MLQYPCLNPTFSRILPVVILREAYQDANIADNRVGEKGAQIFNLLTTVVMCLPADRIEHKYSLY